MGEKFCARAILPTLSLQKNKVTVFILTIEILLWGFLIPYILISCVPLDL